MPGGWIHDTLDLIVFGRVYRPVHAAKDAYAQSRPGKAHRNVGHEWYLAFGQRWNFGDPFPKALHPEIDSLREAHGADVAETRMASDAHDYWDRIWDDLCKMERLHWEGIFLRLLYDPVLLRDWAGVDVQNGRILRGIDGLDVWEECPEIVVEYRDLRRRVSKNHKHRLLKLERSRKDNGDALV